MITQLLKQIIQILVDLLYDTDDTDKSELENKIPDTSGLIKKANYNTRVAEIKFLMLVIQQQKMN